MLIDIILMGLSFFVGSLIREMEKDKPLFPQTWYATLLYMSPFIVISLLITISTITERELTKDEIYDVRMIHSDFGSPDCPCNIIISNNFHSLLEV